MSVPATKHYWRALAIAFAILFTYAAVLVKLSRDWWFDENYSHGLLVPFLIGYILWQQRDKFATEPARPSVLLGGLAVALALFALWTGVAGAELYTQRMSLVLLIAGTVVYFTGLGFLRLILVPLGLLILAIPIPAIVFNKIAFPLQLFASRCAVWSMSVLGIPVLRQGNVIELKPLNSFDTKKLEVVEACSGIRSLMALAGLAVIYVYFAETRCWRRMVLVAAVVPIAVLANAARVAGTGLLAHYRGVQAAEGFLHNFSGLLIFLVAVLLLLALAKALDLIEGIRRRRLRLSVAAGEA
jgi:exosortase